MNENVNHPAHYNIPGRKECIVEMLDKFGYEKLTAFCQLNAYKYRYRHELKNGQEDLDKAEWYERKQKELEKEDPRFFIADVYGQKNQQVILIEEMAELTQALCKISRMQILGTDPMPDEQDFYDQVMDNLIEEMADVSLVLDQMIHLLDCGDRVRQIKKLKAQRTIERMEED